MLGALAFQYLGGLPPCEMCIWQRYPHVIAIALGAFAFLAPSLARPIALLGLAAALSTSGIGMFHAGVEQGWWEGITACTGGGNATEISADDLLAQIMDAPLVRCDQIPWSLFGLSMAAWNALISLGLAGLWWRALQR
jgi:disulfide bond formation protein DsbB